MPPTQRTVLRPAELDGELVQAADDRHLVVALDAADRSSDQFIQSIKSCNHSFPINDQIKSSDHLIKTSDHFVHLLNHSSEQSNDIGVHAPLAGARGRHLPVHSIDYCQSFIMRARFSRTCDSMI